MVGDHIHQLLVKREKADTLINIAVLGTGWFGSGLIQELFRYRGMEPRVVFTQDAEKATDILADNGVSRSNIRAVRTPAELRRGLDKGQYLVSEVSELIAELKGIDAVFDTTGNILFGAQAALDTLQNGRHFITISAELDCAVGSELAAIAAENKVIYSVCDGDQPGCLARVIHEAKSFGMEIIVAGNCKGFLDVHKTPEDIMPWVRPGQNPKMITAFTDGTKQAMELATVANAFGLKPDKRGMHGPKTSKSSLVQDFLKIITQKGVVDYTLGIDGVDQGGGIFVIGKREGDRISEDMAYLKKGEGPYYLFFRDHHLCYFEAPRSISDVVLLGVPTMAPIGRSADVFAVAKRDLKAGERLDGIGGYTVYGLIDAAETVRAQNLFPVGLAEQAVVNTDIPQDVPLTWKMIDLAEDNVVLQLMRQGKQPPAKENLKV